MRVRTTPETLLAATDVQVLQALLGGYADAPQRLVEVGVHAGATSGALLDALPSLRVVGVDPSAPVVIRRAMWGVYGDWGGVPRPCTS